jgi:hypothetical protein
LPISTDDDGNVYNGTGYKTGVRYSSSSKAEVTAEGGHLSGWIDIDYDDVVYLKNISINSGGATNMNNVVFMNNDKTNVFNRTVAQLKSDLSAVVDSNGNVTQFSINGASNGWMRINASYIGADSIVTINQPIE